MRKILTILFLLSLTLTLSLNAQTTRQLKVYQKTGMVDVVRMNANGSVKHSCTDLNGQEHQDYVSIVVTDAEGHDRQYLISQIDSLVLPTGQHVVFIGSMTERPSYARMPLNWMAQDTNEYRRSSFSGDFPGKGTGNVTFFWTEYDHIRLDVGAESRAEYLTNDKTGASFFFDDDDLDAPSYMVYYPDKRVTIPAVQTQTGADNTDHIGHSGDCGFATATRNEDDGSYNFTLIHKAAYLCFLPHIDHLPSAKVEKIVLTCNNPIAGTYQLSGDGLYNGTSTSNSITLNLNAKKDPDFFVGHNIQVEQDTCAAYMVIVPQAANTAFTATYYVTDTLSHISVAYMQRFTPSFAIAANTVYPVTCRIPEGLFRSVDLGISARWCNVNAGANEPSKWGVSYSSDIEAEEALLQQTVVTEWIMPTVAQKNELLNHCTWERGTYMGQQGWMVTGTTASTEDGNVHRIFIPAAEGITPAQALASNYRRPVEALMIDLGLTSGTLWASRNIGAGSPEAYGNYFAWGETQQKSYYSYSNYAFYKNSTWLALGDISGTQNDAAHILWGGLWHMPNKVEWQELIDECTWTWKTNYINGVNGYLITGANGHSIFLPAAGNLRDWNTSPSNSSTVAHYPTSLQSTNSVDYIWAMNCHTGWNSGKPYFGQGSGENHQYRAYGRVIRAVASAGISSGDMQLNITTDAPRWTFGSNSVTLYGTVATVTPVEGSMTVGFVVGDSVNIDLTHCEKVYQQTLAVAGRFSKDTTLHANLGKWYRAFVKINDECYYGEARHYGLEMVDLDLPSGLLWANMNVGADCESDYGGFYAWGETSLKSDYSQNTYQYYQNGWIEIAENISGTKYDAAMANMGAFWRTPTRAEYRELIDNTTHKEVIFNGVACWKFTSKTNPNKFIYFPKNGRKDGTSWNDRTYGLYMTATRYDYYRFHDVYMPPNGTPACSSANNSGSNVNEKRKGYSVRAVYNKIAGGGDERVVVVTTHDADWQMHSGDSKATLHGAFISNEALNGTATVGFVVGDSTLVDENHHRFMTEETVSRECSFSYEVDLHDNIGYWYRAYVKMDNKYYFGEAKQYGIVMVDLGLPSGTKWANMNVGANTPIQAGGYYAWGETTTKSNYAVETYQYYKNAWIDIAEDISGTEYDAAMVNMGTLWRTPTRTQCNELRSADNCTWTTVLIDNVWCWKVQSKKNHNYIILPKSGYKNGTSTYSWNSEGYYLTSTRYDHYREYYFYTGSNADSQLDKRYGATVRAVMNADSEPSDYGLLNVVTDTTTWRLGQQQVTLRGHFNTSDWITGNLTAGFIVGDSVNIDAAHCEAVETVTPLADGSFSMAMPVYDNVGRWYRAYVKVGSQYYYGQVRQYGVMMVDLGLPTGTKWANVNVAASVPQGAGGYYAWGETSTKSNYTVETYQYYKNDWIEIATDISGTEYDAAMANMGALWRTPTRIQCNELRNANNCTWTTVLIDNVWCWKVQSKKNHNYIILPKSGYKNGTSTYSWNSEGHYLTSTRYDHYRAYYFYTGSNADSQLDKRYGATVRAVMNADSELSDYGMLNVVTDTTTWRLGQQQVTMRGYFRTIRQITGDVTVGFLIGEKPGMVKGEESQDLNETVSDTCHFSRTISVTNNQGAWYRAYVKVGAQYYYGEGRQYGLFAVDLGLPTGTKWANLNIGADVQEAGGYYYAWGETMPAANNNYNSVNCALYGKSSADISGTEYDAANTNWGGTWRIPTKTQFEELYNTTFCTCVSVPVHGVWCHKLTSRTNGCYIYLPVAGFMNGTTLNSATYAHYWTSTPYNNNNSYYVYFYSNNSSWYMATTYQYYGMSIRPVK